MEWGLIDYPQKFNPPTLHKFTGKGSPSQHIYYFRSQMGNIATNDALLTRFFVVSLQGLAFDWFMKLQSGSIKTFNDLESFFLAQFFDDDSKVTVTTLLETN